MGAPFLLHLNITLIHDPPRPSRGCRRPRPAPTLGSSKNDRLSQPRSERRAQACKCDQRSPYTIRMPRMLPRGGPDPDLAVHVGADRDPVGRRGVPAEPLKREHCGGAVARQAGRFWVPFTSTTTRFSAGSSTPRTPRAPRAPRAQRRRPCHHAMLCSAANEFSACGAVQTPGYLEPRSRPPAD